MRPSQLITCAILVATIDNCVADAAGPNEQRTEIECSVDAVRWDSESGKVHLTITWSNMSDSLYMCLYDDMRSRFVISSETGEKINGPPTVSYTNDINVIDIVRIHPGTRFTREFSFNYFIKRVQAGNEFIAVYFGTSGAAYFEPGATYSIRQYAYTRCDSKNTVIWFPEKSNRNSLKLKGSDFVESYGHWIPRTDGRSLTFTVPKSENLGDSRSEVESGSENESLGQLPRDPDQ